MPVKKLTNRFINSVKPPEHGYTLYHDTEAKTLMLRVTAGGAKSFCVGYTLYGKKRRVTIGHWPSVDLKAARTRAAILAVSVQAGVDPFTKPETAIMTVNRYVMIYLRDVQVIKKSWKEDRRYLNELRESVGSKPLADLTRQEISMLHRNMGGWCGDGSGPKHPAKANRFLASVSAMLSAAVEDGFIAHNPAKGIRRLRENPPRRRTLTPEEEQRLDEVLLSKSVDIQIAFRLMRETGARTGEVMNAHWGDIDFENLLWHLPNTKSGKPQMIPLNRALAAYLKFTKSYLNAGIGNHVVRGPIHGIRNAWKQIRKEAGLEDVTIHDLRRTVGLKVAMKHGLHVAKELLRHSDISVTTEIYAPLSIEALRGAVEDLSEE